MKKTYLSPVTEQVVITFFEQLLNTGTVLDDDGEYDSGLGTGEGDPQKNENGDFYSDAKYHAFDPWTGWDD